jgi:hypothetical protein
MSFGRLQWLLVVVWGPRVGDGHGQRSRACPMTGMGSFPSIHSEDKSDGLMTAARA